MVSEVMSNKTRLSISGWFHGKPVDRPSPYKEVTPKKHSPLSVMDDILMSWINPMYLQADIVDDIRESFEENSEIELKDFLLESKYKSLLEELYKDEIDWKTSGPPNKRKFEKANEDSLTGPIQECFRMFKSEPMFKLLTTFTGLNLSNVNLPCKVEETNKRNSEETAVEDLVRQDNQCGFTCYGSVCRWSQGCYTLIHDHDPEANEMALDAFFFLNCNGWKEDFGGYTSYLAREEDEELLTVYPCSNSLALTYRDTDTVKFVKHINNRCKRRENDRDLSHTKHSDHYYNVMFTYFE